MSPDAMEDLGVALIRGARAIRENARLRAKIAMLEKQADDDLDDRIAHSREMAGTVLTAILNGVISVPAKKEVSRG